MAMTRLSDLTPRMTLPRSLLSEALRLARSPLSAVHLACGLAAGLARGEHYGLGLHVASEAASAHGGSVSLANSPSGGAVATIAVPLCGA